MRQELIAYAAAVLGYGAAALLATLEYGLVPGIGLLVVCTGVLLLSQISKLTVIRYVLVSTSIIAVVAIGLHMALRSGTEEGSAVSKGAAFVTDPPKFQLTEPLGTARPECPSLHRVAAGESLASIGAAYNVNFLQLQLVNGVKNPSLIRQGETLYLPCPPSGDASLPGQEVADDRAHLTVLAAEMLSCFMAEIRQPDVLGIVQCAEEFVLNESAEDIRVAIDTIGEQVASLTSDFSCAHGHVLQTDAFVDGAYARISGVLELHLGGGVVGRSLRLVYSYEAAKIGSEWRISNWGESGVEPADQPVGLTEAILCA